MSLEGRRYQFGDEFGCAYPDVMGRTEHVVDLAIEEAHINLPSNTLYEIRAAIPEPMSARARGIAWYSCPSLPSTHVTRVPVNAAPDAGGYLLVARDRTPE